MVEEKCPVCGAGAGKYRMGTCGPGCDMVLGDDVSSLPALLLVLLILAVVVSVLLAVVL